MKKKVLIINYGSGNYSSIAGIFKKFNCEVKVDNTKKSIDESEIIVFPGVGTFPAAINTLKKKLILNHVKKEIKKGKNLLGICLGMQILSQSSDEIKYTKGLKLISGSTKKISPSHHIGWNKVFFEKDSIFEPLNKKNFIFSIVFILIIINQKKKDFLILMEIKYKLMLKVNIFLVFNFTLKRARRLGMIFLKYI